MTRPPNKVIDLSPTLHLADCLSGFWLYDDTLGMNLSMSAKTETDALVEALTYYQDRLRRMESDYLTLKGQVDAFVSQFTEGKE